MKVEYKQLTTIKQFEECAKLQKEIFLFSDFEVIPPALLRVFAREHHPLGITVGCFIQDNQIEKMIGFTIGIADLEKDSMYILLIGIIPEYQNKIYGIHLGLKLREIALNKGIKYLYSSFDPLEIRIARTYFGYGMLGFEYIENEYQIDENRLKIEKTIPTDKVLLKWDLPSPHVLKKINKSSVTYNVKDVTQTIPLLTKIQKIENKQILIEIPENFSIIKKEDFKIALRIRMKIRELLKEYINNRKYLLKECITGKINKKRKSYYLLEKIALN